MTCISSQNGFTGKPVPARAGIGLKFPHIAEILETTPPVAFFEIHAENFMSAGGPSIQVLEKIRSHYPVSVHGVGLSLGGSDPLDKDHLQRLKHLVDWCQPGLVSEHLAWCSSEGRFLNDLLPVPYDKTSLASVIDHVNETQDLLGRTILIENPSLYVGYKCSDLEEPAFLNEVARRTGCGILLDINNVVVSASNLAFDPIRYLTDLDLSRVREIHLAGHHIRKLQQRTIHIDDHGSPVCDEVWDLYRFTLGHTGNIPTLIEWDTNIPPFETLLAEARCAQKILHDVEKSGGRHVTAA